MRCNPLRPIAWLIPALLIMLLSRPSIATAQIDNDLSPQTFDGNPISVRLETRMPAPNPFLIYRVYSFDEAGRPTRIEQGTDTMGNTLVVEISCDDEGRIVTRQHTFRGNPAMRYEHRYDDAGRLVEVDSINPRTQQIIDRVAHGYDDSGRRSRSTKMVSGRPDEVTTRTFDDEGRLLAERITRDGNEIRSRILRYDEAGCLVEDATTLANGKTSRTVMEFDKDCRPTRRLQTSFAGRRKEVRISYDDAGRKIAEETVKDGDVVERLTWAYTFKTPSKDAVEEGPAANEAQSSP